MLTDYFTHVEHIYYTQLWWIIVLNIREVSITYDNVRLKYMGRTVVVCGFSAEGTSAGVEHTVFVVIRMGDFKCDMLEWTVPSIVGAQF